MTLPTQNLQLHSRISADGTLTLSLAETPVAAPGPGEILVRIEATPINPSDIGLLFGAADMSTAKAAGTARPPRRHRQRPRSPDARHGRPAR